MPVLGIPVSRVLSRSGTLRCIFMDRIHTVYEYTQPFAEYEIQSAGSDSTRPDLFFSDPAGFFSFQYGPFSAPTVAVMILTLILFDLLKLEPENQWPHHAWPEIIGALKAVWVATHRAVYCFLLVAAHDQTFTDASLAQTSVSSSQIDDQTTSDRILLYATSFFATVSFLAIGASVGSYLNVIVYRVPRKIPLTFTRSGCPKCGAPIHLSDNIPIISWCRLKGRCRACQAPISIRYPLVEISVAVIFLTLYFSRAAFGGSQYSRASS